MSPQRQVSPALVPYLTGAKKDFGSLQDSIVKVNSIFLPLVILATGTRLYVRFCMLRAVGPDDS